MRSKAYQQLREHLTNTAKERKTPILGHFELTSRCNLDCKMCYVHSQNNAEALQRELTTEQWKQIFDEAYDCGMLYAHLTGGECLIRKDFKELYLHLRNKGVRVSIQTNCTLLNDDYLEFFKTYPPDEIRTSLYGSSEEGYLNVTGHKGFEKAIAAISAIQEAGIDISVGVTPSKYMHDYIDILCLCQKKGFEVLYNDLLLLPSRDNPGKNDYYLTEEEILSLAKQRAELRKKLVPVEDTPEPFGSMDKAPDKGLTCNAGNCLSAVSWTGKMHPCLNAMVNDGADVLKLGYAEAWRQTVEAAAHVEHAIECVGCAYNKICPKCPAHRLDGFYSGHCNSAICELTRKLVAAGVKKLN